MLDSAAIEAAETFIWLNARILDRHRYTYLFKGGDPEAVVAALRPYQNADGGFGNALEPDDRGQASQPTHGATALEILDEVGQFQLPMATRTLDYLASVATPEGGVPVALPSIRLAPRAPWWDVGENDPPASLLPTAAIVGLMHRHGIQDAWLAAATDFCWRGIMSLSVTHPYEVEYCVKFLDNAPDRSLAGREAERLGQLMRTQRLVLLDPDTPDQPPVSPGYAPGEYHSPLDYAPSPASLARRWFSNGEIERNLDLLERAQGADGGWSFNWRAWNPATTIEWRGLVTIRALATLRAYGRLSG